MKKIIMLIAAVALLFSGVAFAVTGYGYREDFVVKKTWANGQKECQKWGKKMAGVSDFRGVWPQELAVGFYWTSTLHETDKRMATIIIVKKNGNQIESKIGAYRIKNGNTGEFNVWCKD